MRDAWKKKNLEIMEEMERAGCENILFWINASLAISPPVSYFLAHISRLRTQNLDLSICVGVYTYARVRLLLNSSFVSF